jgi:hypothetical protein
VTLSRGRTAETFTAVEMSPSQAAPMLRRYLAEYPLTAGGYFDVSKHSRREGFTAKAGKHPVFGLDATGS